MRDRIHLVHTSGARPRGWSHTLRDPSTVLMGVLLAPYVIAVIAFVMWSCTRIAQ